MAVDANVLIFERIREEVAAGRSVLSAIDQGYKMAYNTILDANITTIICVGILYLFGSGPIKGFAVTLIIGILCSMFTAVTFSKVVLSLFYKDQRNIKLEL
jgi:preprotein translocase subunit SecD